MLPVFSRSILPSIDLCNLFFRSTDVFTIKLSFLLSGITAIFIGARCGFRDKTVLSLLFSRLSILYASLRIAKKPLSTPADGSITYGTTHFFVSRSWIASFALDCVFSATFASILSSFWPVSYTHLTLPTTPYV